MLRTTLADFFHPEDASLATTARERALADRRPFVIEQRVVHADGDVRQTVTRGEVVSDAAGAVAGMRGTTQDVTEQRRAATAVLEARAALMRQTMELAEEHRVKESLQRAVLPARLPRRRREWSWPPATCPPTSRRSSAVTGTTPSASPTAALPWPPGTSSVTTWMPPRPWVRCATPCAPTRSATTPRPTSWRGSTG